MEHRPSNDRRAGVRGRHGWRHLLPIVQTLLYGALVWWGFRERYSSELSAFEQPSEYVLVQEGEGVEWNPRYVDAPPPRGFTIAWALNLPAVLPALLILVPAGALLKNPGSFARDLLAAGIIGVFVPFIWYGVGWWIDDRLGRSAPRLFTLPTPLRVILAAIALLLSLPTLALGILLLIWALAHGEVGRHADILLGMLGWSGWFFWISLAKAREWRRLASNSQER